MTGHEIVTIIAPYAIIVALAATQERTGEEYSVTFMHPNTQTTTVRVSSFAYLALREAMQKEIEEANRT